MAINLARCCPNRPQRRIYFIELRSTGANIESTSHFLGYNGNSISINGTKVFQGNATHVNSVTSGVVRVPAAASATMTPPVFINQLLPVKLTSFNGETWSAVGAISGMKETHTNTAYSFTDLSPLAGVNYYRLKMIDLYYT